jgi:hypothetical protein
VSPENVAAAASIGCSAVFFVIAGLVYAYRRPKPPPDFPATSDLGAESPAVANLLANGGRLTPDSVPATLFDLAARRAVKIEETEPGQYGCRIGAGSPPALAAYESRVLDLLRERASGGLVPAHALTSGASDQAKRWFKNFRREVVGEAAGAGQCERRWPRRVLTVMGLLVLAALFLGTGAGNEDESLTWPQGIAIVVAIGAAALMAQAFTEDMVMLTPAGAAAQGRWLSLRKFLHDDDMFSSLPPTAVAVRERYLAYGAALGVAAAAVRAIPMGAESDRWAWTQYGGEWRQVRVSYPHRWPLGWGSSPWDIGWTGLWFTVVGGLVLWFATQVLPSVDLGRDAGEATRYISIATVLATFGAAAAVTLGLIFLCAAVAALLVTRTVTGEAIRVRQFRGDNGYRSYLAVYTGKGERVRAYHVRGELFPSLREYSKVTVSVSPLTGFVRTVQPA